ncbi:MAG: hypothetical protein HOH14_02620 [Gammaproteobacteria bacterium]|jgi:hypothetical protein|nr:hypothetical protein [Gammaproteobacteria bacterium]MBT5485025.1 hypothetical protein [Gammaproteobacteria bacterium]MBT6042369.1 hypothetical protein [Gammaproteobacteria bacterium]
MLETISDWLQSTWLSHAFISQGLWAWPMSESLHFIGLCLLVGSVGLVDLRMLGMAKGISVSALHKLIPFGVAGYLLNVITGSLFVVGDADQYIFNDAFRFKMLFMFIAGINVLFFYSTAFQQTKLLGPNDEMPLPVKIMAGVSLACWIGIICAGRLITFYRP